MSGPTGGWRVQIASVKNEDVAKSTWARLQSAHGDVLANLRMQAVRVDLGDKGVWYRVQAGPLDEKQAHSVCGTLKSRKTDCVIVPPARMSMTPSIAMSRPRAAIFGCAGPDLTADERAFFRDADPLGFILFARNVDTPERTRRLVEELRSCVARAEAPVLIDQEGGRVARLRPPHWRKAPPARLLGELYARDPEHGLEATRLNSRLLAADVASIGCDVDCLPVLDIAFPETHAVIGDRAYADRPEPVAALGRAAAEGLLAEGVMPVIKHIPGHGRATVD